MEAIAEECAQSIKERKGFGVFISREGMGEAERKAYVDKAIDAITSNIKNEKIDAIEVTTREEKDNVVFTVTFSLSTQ
jgi:hypothetical protein